MDRQLFMHHIAYFPHHFVSPNHTKGRLANNVQYDKKVHHTSLIFRS